jgi:hypothetical protein
MAFAPGILPGLSAPTRKICAVFSESWYFLGLNCDFLGPCYPAPNRMYIFRKIKAETLLLTRAGRIPIAVRKFEHYSNWVVCTFCASAGVTVASAESKSNQPLLATCGPSSIRVARKTMMPCIEQVPCAELRELGAGPQASPLA